MPDVTRIARNNRASSSSHDTRIAELASRQYGVVGHAQLLALGLARSTIQYRVTTGRLHRLHLGVYSVGHRVVSGDGRMMAAVLACGPGSLISHVSAGGLWGVMRDSRPVIDVTVAARRAHRGVVVHSVRRIHDRDRTVIDGIPATSMARTMLDVAGVVPAPRLERALETAERLGLFDLRALNEVLERTRGHHGACALRAAIGAYRDLSFQRSGLERRFLALCRAAGLPAPSTNLWIAEQEVDALWERQRVAVELDSFEFHRTRAAFERDRIRDSELQRAGYRVLRVTDRRMIDAPDEVVAAVRELLAVTT